MTKTTTKNRRAVGTLGIAAVVAVLAVSMIAMNFTSPVLADHQPAKKGYVGGSELSGITSEGYVIEPFLFKTNNGGDIVFDLTVECTTMTHIEGKGKMKDGFDGANVDAKVWFVWKENQVGPWQTIPIGPYDASVGDAGKWNLCEQDFQIKTNLNDLFSRCTAEQVGDPLFPECTKVGDLFFECDIEGNPRPGFEDSDCEQSVALFLKTAGTRPAAALLMNVPNGIHSGAVMAEITVNGQFMLDPEECIVPGDISTCDIKTALMIGKRLLIVEDIHLANDAGL